MVIFIDGFFYSLIEPSALTANGSTMPATPEADLLDALPSAARFATP
jgi:hypothetical protein